MVVQLKKKERKSIVGVRLEPQIVKVLDQKADKHCVSRSELIRQVLADYAGIELFKL